VVKVEKTLETKIKEIIEEIKEKIRDGRPLFVRPAPFGRTTGFRSLLRLL
jgi:hypothetical protein